jgi:RND family efflux transporter MFP subunit
MSGDDLQKLKIEKSASAPRRTGGKALRLWILLGAMAAVAILAWLYTARSIQVTTAAVTRIYPSQDFTVLNASGYVVAQRRAAVAAKITGRLVWVGVEEGNRVREGEIIARLENEDVKAAVAQAEAELARVKANVEQARAERQDAERNYRRLRDLLTAGFVSQSEVDIAEARLSKANAAVVAAASAVKAAAAALLGAQVNLEYTYVRAPFDAVVLTKNADVGDIVTPIGAAAEAKAAVVTIADMDSLVVEADVAEASLGKVRVGQPCEIQLDAFPDARFPGVLHMVVPTADRARATVLVKVRFLDKDPRILPEMSARVAFLERPVTPAEEQPRTAVAPSAVVTREGRSVLFLIRDGRAVETPVTTGERIGDFVEILQGTEPGEQVVLQPPARLKDGARVRTVQ